MPWRQVLLIASVWVVSACGRMGFAGERLDAQAQVDAVVDPRLILWLAMDTDPNAGIIDLARGHTSACAATCPGLISAARAGGYDFVNQQITVAHVADLDTPTEMTLAMWVRFHRYNGSYQNLICKPLGTVAQDSDSYCLSIDAGGQMVFYTNSAIATDDFMVGSVVPVGEWHHIAMTWNGTTKAGYIDGTLDVAKSGVSVAFDENPLLIAADNITLFLDGALDDVRLYSAVLPLDEIQALATP